MDDAPRERDTHDESPDDDRRIDVHRAQVALGGQGLAEGADNDNDEFNAVCMENVGQGRGNCQVNELDIHIRFLPATSASLPKISCPMRVPTGAEALTRAPVGPAGSIYAGNINILMEDESSMFANSRFPLLYTKSSIVAATLMAKMSYLQSGP